MQVEQCRFDSYFVKEENCREAEDGVLLFNLILINVPAECLYRSELLSRPSSNQPQQVTRQVPGHTTNNYRKATFLDIACLARRARFFLSRQY
jgi:hypothetical protein